MSEVQGVVLACLLAGTCLTPISAHAQAADKDRQAAPAAHSDTESGLEAIVVTARRKAENLQDVPIAISAISSASLKAKGILETTDLAGSTPSLQINSIYGKTQPNFTLRGIGVANEFNTNSASPVGVYVDEVYQDFRYTHGQQLFDLDRIEILRGPQGTLYGRNTTGGAVSFFTVEPSLKDAYSGYLTVGAGTYGLARAEGAVEATLIPDQLGLRVAGTYENSHAYVHNINGPDSGAPEIYAFRGTLRYRSSAGFEAILKAYTAQTKGGQENDFSANTTPNNAGPITFGGIGAAFGLSYTPPNGNYNNYTTVTSDGAGYALVRTSGVVLRVSQRIGDNAKLTSLTGYDAGRYAQLPTTDCDGAPLDLCAVGYSSNTKAFNQEIRLNYGKGPLTVVIGGYYGWDDLKNLNTYKLYGFLDGIRQELGLPATYFNPIGFGLIANPAAFPTPILAITKYEQSRKSAAIFGESVYKITEKLSFTVGLRYTKDNISYTNGLATLYDETGAPRYVSVSAVDALVPYGPGITPLALYAGSSALTGRGIVSYKIQSDVMVFASFSRGYRSGTFNGTAFQSNEQVSYVPPEHVNAYEAGLKSRWLDNKLQANLAVFDYDYKGQQVEEIVGVTSLTALASLNGILKGGEIELAYQPSRALNLQWSAGYLDSRYGDGQYLSGINVGGNKFPNAPVVSMTGSFDYNLFEKNDRKLVLHGDTTYTGKYYYDPFGTRQATGIIAQGGGKYWLFNSRMTYNSGNFSVSAWVKNLTNKLYFPEMLNLEAGYGIDLRIRAAPRTAGGEVTFRF